MNEYIKADRQLWDLLDDAKYQMMLARMALEENNEYNEHMEENNEEVNKLADMLEETGEESRRFKEFALEINHYLSKNTSISPVLEIESSERTSYRELMEKARTK